MPTKKNVLLIAVIGSVIAVTRGMSLLCDVNNWDCRDKNDSISLFFVIFIPVLVFSLVTYLMNDKVFRAWRNFALVWVPLTVFLVVMTPDTSGSIVAFGKETVAMILSIVFSALSIAIICVTWTIEHFKKKRK